jgi:hypothetical protein
MAIYIKVNGSITKSMGKVVKYEQVAGIMQYSNGDVYEGQWKNDDRTGYGKLNYVSGNKYEGQWNNNERDGKGLFLH